MSDSLSPDSNKRLPDEEGPQTERTPETGFGHEDVGNPERGTRPAGQSLVGEPDDESPEHAHQRQVRDSGSTEPDESGDAPPEIAGDDRSLLTGNPPGTKPM